MLILMLTSIKSFFSSTNKTTFAGNYSETDLLNVA